MNNKKTSGRRMTSRIMTCLLVKLSFHFLVYDQVECDISFYYLWSVIGLCIGTCSIFVNLVPVFFYFEIGLVSVILKWNLKRKMDVKLYLNLNGILRFFSLEIGQCSVIRKIYRFWHRQINKTFSNKKSEVIELRFRDQHRLDTSGKILKEWNINFKGLNGTPKKSKPSIKQIFQEITFQSIK
jgi:hypothetical protein